MSNPCVSVLGVSVLDQLPNTLAAFMRVDSRFGSTLPPSILEQKPRVHAGMSSVRLPLATSAMNVTAVEASVVRCAATRTGPQVDHPDPTRLV